VSTLLLTHADVVRLVDGLSLLNPMREGFIAHSRGDTASPEPLLGPAGALPASPPGVLPNVPAASVHVMAALPGSPHPSKGCLLLYDTRSLDLLAVLDASHLISLRTGIVGAVAADVLARPNASRVAVIGAGAQGSMQLKCLRLVRSLTHVRVHDIDPARAHAYALRLYEQVKLPVRVADSVEEAVEDADIIVTATWAREPFLTQEMVRPGTHVTSLGGDETGKAELSTSLLTSAHHVCDDQEATLEHGALARPRRAEGALPAELGQVLSGAQPGRRNPEEVTLFTSVGLPFQDLAAAWLAYQNALEDPDVQRLELDKGAPLPWPRA
jgi:ornithine cyclodeaminase